MNIQIIGTGATLPEGILTNRQLEEQLETSDEWIVARTGISERRIAREGIATSDLAVQAAEQALDSAGITADNLDLIVVATITPDLPFPATACLLQHRLGAARAVAFDISAACSGFLYALVVAQRFLAGEEHLALVVGAETMSRLVDYRDRSTCILFGDGAGAVVLGKGTGPRGIIATYLATDGSGSELLYVPAGGSRLPASESTVTERLHYIKMCGHDVYKFAVKAIPECIFRVLDKVGLRLSDVDHLVLHQANLRIIQAATKKLGLPPEKILVNIQRYGNMSAASIPVVLAEGVTEHIIKDGDLVLMVGFGAGLTMGSALVRWGSD